MPDARCLRDLAEARPRVGPIKSQFVHGQNWQLRSPASTPLNYPRIYNAKKTYHICLPTASCDLPDVGSLYSWQPEEKMCPAAYGALGMPGQPYLID
jgi:hypothetical protein